MAKAKAIELSAGESYGDVAVKVIDVRAAELADRSRGVLDTGDIERVHAMRVATRRLRAALEVFEPCFPRKPHRQVLAQVKQLADGLGERRDPDVAIVALEAFNEQMHETDRKGVASLIEHLRAEQAQANVDLAPLVDAESLAGLNEAITSLLASARGRSEGPQ